MFLLAWEPAGGASLRRCQTLLFEDMKQTLLAVWRPSIFVSVPARRANDDTAVAMENVAFVNMWPVLVLVESEQGTWILVNVAHLVSRLQ